MVAITGLAASGVHLTLFSTGRGNPLGGPVPTVKISSNSNLARRKPHWIDFDAGRLLEEEGLTMDQLADEFLDWLIDVASGKVETKMKSTNIAKSPYLSRASLRSTRRLAFKLPKLASLWRTWADRRGDCIGRSAGLRLPPAWICNRGSPVAIVSALRKWRENATS